MTSSSAHGRLLGPSCAQNAQLMFQQPLFDGFDDLVQLSDAAVCQVVVQSSLTDSLQFAIDSSRQLKSSNCAAQQPFCLPSAKQHIKARSGRMLSSMLAPFSKLHKLFKGRGASEGNGMSGTENAFTSMPDLGMLDLLDQMEEQWSYSSSSNSSSSSSSRRSSSSSNSSGSVLNCRTRRSSSSGSSTYTRSPCETPLSSSTHSPRQSLSTLESDSAYEGSIRGNALHKNTMGKVVGQHHQQQHHQQQEQYQVQHVYDQEGYGQQVYRPMYPNRYQDEAATAELRQMQLARAEQELQDWANASREWSRDIAGYGPSQGAGRQPGGTLYGSRGISPGYSLF